MSLSPRFIEYGMYRGQYYGTRLDSVAEVMAGGRMCLVTLQPAVSDRRHWVQRRTDGPDVMHTVIRNAS